MYLPNYLSQCELTIGQAGNGSIIITLKSNIKTKIIAKPIIWIYMEINMDAIYSFILGTIYLKPNIIDQIPIIIGGNFNSTMGNPN